jgi:hypothetical protein
MRATATVALLLCAGACLAGSASESAAQRAARFFAADLERPLLQLRTGAALIQVCATRLRSACNAEQRKAGSQNVLTLLDALTLFPQRPEGDPGAGVKRARELARKIDEASTALLREAGEYDRHLFARYGATLRVCPDEDAERFRDSLAELRRVSSTGFQALSGNELAGVNEATAREESVLADTVRSWPAEDCVAARKLGEHLMQLMFSKLQPWSGEDKHVANHQPGFEFDAPRKSEVPKDRDLAHAVAGNFVTVVATELQLSAYPESEARIEALVDSAEK